MLHIAAAIGDQPRRVPLQRPDVRSIGERKQWQPSGVRRFPCSRTDRAQHGGRGDTQLGQPPHDLFKLQPFIVTLGGMLLFRGMSQTIAEGGTLSLGGSELLRLANEGLLLVGGEPLLPYPLLIFLAAVVDALTAAGGDVTRGLLVVLLVGAGCTVVGHTAAILSSGRLRAV